MGDNLDIEIEKIYKETLKILPKSVPPPALKQDTTEVRILNDEDLNGMIGYPGDILINAHVPQFDQFVHLHQHTFYELIYVHRGSLKMNLQGKDVIFRQGDFVFMNPGTVHSVELNEKNSQVINILMKAVVFQKTMMYMILSNQVLSDVILPSISGEGQAPTYLIFRKAMQQNHSVGTYLTTLIQEYHAFPEAAKKPRTASLQESAIEIPLCGLLLRLSMAYREQNPVSESTLRKNITATDISQYLTSHLDQATLEETAAHFHYNPKYFSRIIQKLLGKSFSAYLQDLRITKAKALLVHTDQSIVSISHQVGYENTSHFYALFQKNVGMSPKEYRNLADS